MAPKLFTKKVRDSTVARVASKEQIVGRVLNARDAMAGTTAKWECFIVDGDTMKDILLVEAFGAPLIKKCKGELKDNKVVAIDKYQIVAKGKAMTFANRPLKLAIQSDAAIAEQADDESLPARLPTVSLDAVENLAGGCLISLLVVTKSQGAAIERDTSVGKKLVCNCDVMAASTNIALLCMQWSIRKPSAASDRWAKGRMCVHHSSAAYRSSLISFLLPFPSSPCPVQDANVENCTCSYIYVLFLHIFICIHMPSCSIRSRPVPSRPRPNLCRRMLRALAKLNFLENFVQS